VERVGGNGEAKGTGANQRQMWRDCLFLANQSMGSEKEFDPKCPKGTIRGGNSGVVGLDIRGNKAFPFLRRKNQDRERTSLTKVTEGQRRITG